MAAGRRRVALTGRAVVSPLGVGIDAHWNGLLAGRCAVEASARLAALGLDVARGASVAPELVQPHLGRLPRKQQKLYNRATLFGMLAAALGLFFSLGNYAILAAFANHTYRIPFETAGKKWVRFAAWDSAGNGALTQPLWEFRPRGQSGKMISEMLPRLAGLADDLCFIHSMTANSNTHGLFCDQLPLWQHCCWDSANGFHGQPERGRRSRHC